MLFLEVNFNWKSIQINFQGNSWGEIELDEKMVEIMNIILDDELYRYNQSKTMKQFSVSTNLYIPVIKVDNDDGNVYYSLKNIKGIIWHKFKIKTLFFYFFRR